MTDILPFRWLPDSLDPIRAAAVRRAALDVGLMETLVPNRHPIIDEYNRRAGAPLGSPWCASAVTAWWEDAGVPELPAAGRADCDVLMRWAKRTGRWKPAGSKEEQHAPLQGDISVYGSPGDARHVGLVCRLTPVLSDVQANTSATGFSREGVLCTVKTVETKRLLGLISPFRLNGNT